MSPLVQQFIRENASADVSKLLFKNGDFASVPMREIVEQIVSRKKAKAKTPFLYRQNNIVFPPKISMEQCSSELTALYKSRLVCGGKGADLTGGAGIDSYFFSKNFKQFNYVEQNKELVNVVTHNFKVLNANNISTHVGTAEDFITRAENNYDFFYIDPSRRDSNKNKVFLFSECTPNIALLKNELLNKARKVMVKASPLVDIKKGIEELGNVEEVHIVAVENECKELLFIMSGKASGSPKIICANYKKTKGWDSFEYSLSEEEQIGTSFAMPQKYLYEPNVALMKAGAFKIIVHRFSISKLHPNSHLYTSEKLIQNFPGRTFEIGQTLKYDIKALKKILPDKKANITCRNFPETVQQIRKKTKIEDGGDIYLFATTDKVNKKIIVSTKKLS